ncbi:MAG TPA: hypothetical protein ENH62_05855 [Marinobacter sp.]|uniref:Uncharacterized protein n=1 Tax=marine sediment metagenome TaxID=412755 RepID=A0A0F9TAA4_9ZZZZ|nr:hypothetical protein [Marinobacter sp.]
MTIKNFFIDLWLTLRFGKWRVKRYHAHAYGDWGGPNRWHWEYRAEHSRSDQVIHCISKRIAEGACAAENDLRGTAPSGDDLRLP